MKMQVGLALIASALLLSSSAFAGSGTAAGAVNEDSLDKAQTQVQNDEQKPDSTANEAE